jgi:hypothetical protein
MQNAEYIRKRSLRIFSKVGQNRESQEPWNILAYFGESRKILEKLGKSKFSID